MSKPDLPGKTEDEARAERSPNRDASPALDWARRFAQDRARESDALWAFLLALGVRVAIALWAGSRFPPVEDGRFYQTLATRLAEGRGYTWQWPDGVVTFVAHYPVGYPALLSVAYRLFGNAPLVAMLFNAAIGAVAVIAVHQLAAEAAGRWGALFAALAVALHPALTLYTSAVMTEGVTAALLACAAWLVVVARRRRGPARLGILLALGALFGVATLVRGQSLLLAPLFGVFAAPRPGSGRGARAVLGSVAVTTLACVLVVAPWTARNCSKMDRCVVVSANLGWNLLIGATEGATGTFVPIQGESVPAECRTVFGEADKDACFTQAAVREVIERPGRWLALIPAKLSHTFEYCGAAGWYLHAANPTAFPDPAKLRLGVVETAWQRVLMALGLYAMARVPGRRSRARRVLAIGGCLALLGPFGFVAYLALGAGALALGAELREHVPLGLAAAAVGATALTHAVFFGAGRYSLPVFALTAALAGTAWRQSAEKSGSQAPPAF